MQKENIDFLVKKLEEFGTYKTGIVEVKDIVFEPEFRKMCESNACGKYGKCWTCPPDAGAIDELIAYAKQFDMGIVYQTVGELEDSYDFEGMIAAGAIHNDITKKLQKVTIDMELKDCLHLGAGGCRVCETCTKPQNQPCRAPHLALKSLETFGIDVTRLAALANMNYINGQNTVTHFGCFFYKTK